jgi:hypothetical protein
MKLRVAIIIALTIIGHEASAHKDRILHLSEDGTIVDLPSEYQPATLRLDFGKIIALRLGKFETTLPYCLAKLPKARSSKDIEITGSWNHNESIIPYYLRVLLFDPAPNPTASGRSGYALTFNLHTSKLLDVERIEASEDGSSAEDKAVDLRSECTRAEIEGAFGTDRPWSSHDDRGAARTK